MFQWMTNHPNWTQFYRSDFTSAKWRGKSLPWSSWHLLTQFRILLTFFTQTCCPPGSPGCYLQSCFPGSLSTACSGAWSYSTFALTFIELHEVSVSLFHQLAEMSLNSSPTFYFLPEFGVIGVLAVSSFSLITRAINKDIKQYQPLYQTLRNWSPIQAIGIYSFSGAAQPDFFTNLVVHPPSPDLPGLTTTVLWETVSKALLKPC